MLEVGDRVKVEGEILHRVHGGRRHDEGHPYCVTFNGYKVWLKEEEVTFISHRKPKKYQALFRNAAGVLDTTGDYFECRKDFDDKCWEKYGWEFITFLDENGERVEL